MYRKISKMICVFRKLDVFEFEHMGVDVHKETTSHDVKHKYREEMILPIISISNAYDFFIFNESSKIVTTADGIKCVVSDWSEENVCDLEEDIKRLYDMDAWSFIKIWRNTFPQMTSMQFVKMKLKKYED